MSETNVQGDGTAVAGAHSTINISNTFNSAATPTPADDATRVRAGQLLARLPLDRLADHAALPGGSRMSIQRNRQFVGRDADLRALAEVLKTGGAAAIGHSPAITGTGGLGKTQLAVELVWRYGQYFAGGVFWLSFADPAAIRGEIAECGRSLGLGADFDTLRLDARVAQVMARWQDGLPRLLVFDNCEDPALFQAWCPPAGQCRVILTSRRMSWPAHLGIQAQPLTTLPRDQSIAMLRGLRPELSPAELDPIADELGDLPLALHLAATYLAAYAVEPSAYLAAIRRPDLLSHGSLTHDNTTPTGHDGHVARTFAVSWSKLDPERDALAIRALAHAAHFAPGEVIPWRLLAGALGLDHEDEADRHRLIDAVRRLADLGLVSPGNDGPTLHRLIAAFARSKDDQVARTQESVERAIAEASAADINSGLPRRLMVWQAHLRHASESAVNRNSEWTADLLSNIGEHLWMIADFGGARAMLERAQAIIESTLGPDAPYVAIALSRLGGVLRDLGDLPATKEAIERALAIIEATHGPDHPSIALALVNLGITLRDLDDLPAAKAAIERGLEIVESTHGPNHPDVALALGNLGNVLRDSGDINAAKEFFKRSLAIVEETHGPNHPYAAIHLNNLGNVLRDLNDLSGARAALTRALDIVERSLPPGHPHIQLVRKNLAPLTEEE